MTLQKYQKCVACKQTDYSKLLEIDKFGVTRCNNCGLLSLWPQSLVEKNKDYRSALELISYVRYTKPLRQKQYRQELAELKKFARGRKLLDVGCAMGWFIKEAKEARFEAEGLELQADLARVARDENPKSKIMVGDIESLSNINRYDVVTLWSVIEHFGDAQMVIQKIHGILNEKGILAIRTPNSRGLAENISIFLYKVSWGKIRIPIEAVLQLNFASKHWWLFNPENLSMILKNNGYRIVKEYYSTSVDWQNLELWLKSRKIKTNVLLISAMKFVFLINDFLSKKLKFADDFVMFAQKI